MSEFQVFLKLGLQHILDVNGYDHIAFVIALCALYQLQHWRNVLILVTAFTLGHSITLALSTLEVVTVDRDLIEFLIPVTIFITAFSNLFSKAEKSKVSKLNYFFAGCFGLIHGLGFSNYLKSILGRDESIITQLLAFNIGLELGQIIIVAVFLISAYLFVSIFGVNRRDWRMITSAMVAGVSMVLIMQTNYL